MALNTQEGKNWKLLVNQAGTATLATSGTYLDRDIEIEVPKAEYSINPTGSIKGSTVDPKIEATIADQEGSITKSPVVSSSQPTTGEYFVIAPDTSVLNTGTAKVSVKANTVVSKEGYLAEADATEESGLDVDILNVTVEGVGINNSKAYYLPIKELSNDSLKASTEHLTGESGQAQDSLTVSIKIPEGYYKEHTLTQKFDDLLPDLDGATDDEILFGKEVYDEDGNKIVGTMANHSADAPELNQIVEDGYSSIEGTAITLSEDDTSGIAIKASGTIAATAIINEDGYYVSSASEEEFLNSPEKVQYVTDINVTAGKTLNSISIAGSGASVSEMVNNGTVTELKGTGSIGTLSGSQTVNKLTGTITIQSAEDLDPEVEESNGNVVFGTTTLVKDGSLIEATTTTVNDTVVIGTGWVTTPQQVGVKPGSYEVECESEAPSIEYVANPGTVRTTQIPNAYQIKFSGDITPGSHKATATITDGGYIAAGSKSTESEEILVIGGESSASIYLAEASYSGDVSATKYADSDVPEEYIFAVSQDGYTTSGEKATIPVFNGDFAWG